MLRNLYADARKTLYCKGFHIGLALLAAYLIINGIYNLILCKIFGGYIIAEELIFSFNGVAIFWITASTLIISDRDFADGCIRNKLISGVTRTDTFISAVFGGMLQGVIYSLVAFVGSYLISLVLSKGFFDYTAPETAGFFLVTVMTCIAIGAFSTTLVMVFGGSKIVYVVGLTLAFGMSLLTEDVLDKLYPGTGYCKLTGAKLAIYSFIDKFVPYSYLAAMPHHSFRYYLTGCAGLTIISIVTGLIIFGKKEIK